MSGKKFEGLSDGGSTGGLPVWPHQWAIKEVRSRGHAHWPAGVVWGQPEEAVFKWIEGKEKDIPRTWAGMA